MGNSHHPLPPVVPAACLALATGRKRRLVPALSVRGNKPGEGKGAEPERQPLDAICPDFGEREVMRVPDISQSDQGEKEMAERNNREPSPRHAQGPGMAETSADDGEINERQEVTDDDPGHGGAGEVLQPLIHSASALVHSSLKRER